MDNTKLELLDAGLLVRLRPRVQEFRALANELGLSFGWHYLLDLAWVADQIGDVRGKTILDAGAGMGVMQWYLADRGARVISVDRMTRRRLADHFYRRYRIHALTPQDTPENLPRPYPQVTSSGEIVLHTGDLSWMPEITDQSVDLVVSISSVEHNELDSLPRVVAEVERILKDGGRMFITLSATSGRDFYHQQSKGWVLTEAALREIFKLNGASSNFAEFQAIFSGLKNCRELADNLAPFYFQSGDNGMPWGVWDPQYQPVGIMKVKSEPQRTREHRDEESMNGRPVTIPQSAIRNPHSEIERDRVLRLSQQRLVQFRDRHRGQRCVIVGNGPSLNRMDLSWLKNEITFGMNRIFLGLDKFGFKPTYHVAVNPLVLEQSVDGILGLECPKFLSANGLKWIGEREDIFYLLSRPGFSFSVDVARDWVWEGHTVTYVAMQLAFYMGFSEVVLIGVDHHFPTAGQANKEIVSDGGDPNHFHPEYFGKGFRWNLPDLVRSERSYQMAKLIFEGDGRRILDATDGGQLTVVPKVDWRDYSRQPSAVSSQQSTAGTRENQLGEECYAAGRIKEALTHYGRALEQNPNDARVWNNIGVAKFALGEIPLAGECLAKAIEYDPHLHDAYLNISDLLKSMGNEDGARKVIEKYSQLHPEKSAPVPIL